MLINNGLLWIARDECGNLTDNAENLIGTKKLMCPFCSGEVMMRPGFGFIHQHSPCSKETTATEDNQIQIIADEMLRAGDNLTVSPVISNGILLAPGRINTRKGTNFQYNAEINGLEADLIWISSKGFNMGVIFSSTPCNDVQTTIVEQCFAVVIDTAALAESFRSQIHSSEETLLSWSRKTLSSAGTNAVWRFVASPNHRTTSEFPPVEAYVQDSCQNWQWPENRESRSSSNVKVVMAILHQRVEDPVTQEIVCLCTVKINGHEHDFQVAQYAGQKILMSNVGEALPQSYPNYDLILSSCLKAERRYNFKD